MKDVIYTISILLTFGVGLANLIYNYRNARKTRFINTVTTQRVQWIEQLRQDIAAYTSSVALLGFGQASEGTTEQILERVYRLLRTIRLRLNPSAEVDQEIEELLDKITEELQGETRVVTLSTLLDQLTITAQRLLKAEWEKIKSEAKHGKLSTD